MFVLKRVGKNSFVTRAHLKKKVCIRRIRYFERNPNATYTDGNVFFEVRIFSVVFSVSTRDIEIEVEGMPLKLA